MPAIATLQEVFDNMEHGLYDMTRDGKCSGCGNCCSNYLPLSKDEIRDIKYYIRLKGIREQRHVVGPLAKPLIDLTCPFLDETKPDKKCAIYEHRPEICRTFMCNVPPSKAPIEDRMQFMRTHFPVNVRATFFGGKA